MLFRSELSLPRLDADPLLYTLAGTLSPADAGALKTLNTSDNSGEANVPLVVQVASWIFAPRTLSPFLPAMWLFAIPGGSYRGLAYYDRQVPGFPMLAYSMARFLAAQGIGVVVIDNVGTGASPVDIAGNLLTRQVYAALYQQLIAHLREQLIESRLPIQIEPVPAECLWFGIMGHSMGGFLATHLQATYGSGDGLAVLGWSNSSDAMTINKRLQLMPEQMQMLKSAFVGKTALGGQQLAQLRSWLRPLFYSATVPRALIEADERDATTIPSGLSECMIPGVVAQEAAQIHCPIFLSFGGTDMTDDPHREVTTYRSSTAITLLVQPEAHHCANFELSRPVLWKALASWCRTAAHLTKKPLGLGNSAVSIVG